MDYYQLFVYSTCVWLKLFSLWILIEYIYKWSGTVDTCKIIENKFNKIWVLIIVRYLPKITNFIELNKIKYKLV